MHNKNKLSKPTTLHKCLSFFAFNKEGTIDDVATFIGKNYSTALRVIKKLLNVDFIKLDRTERTSVKGKEKKIYRIMLHGLFAFTLINRELVALKFEEMVEVQKDKLLTFRKWEYFKKKGLEKIVETRFFSSLRKWFVGRQLTFLMVTETFEKPTFPKLVTDENTARAADTDILGITSIVDPPNHTRQHMGEQKWGELMKLFKAIEEDYELRMFKQDQLFWIENGYKERLKSIDQWKELLKNLT